MLLVTFTARLILKCRHLPLRDERVDSLIGRAEQSPLEDLMASHSVDRAKDGTSVEGQDGQENEDESNATFQPLLRDEPGQFRRYLTADRDCRDSPDQNVPGNLPVGKRFVNMGRNCRKRNPHDDHVARSNGNPNWDSPQDKIGNASRTDPESYEAFKQASESHDEAPHEIMPILVSIGSLLRIYQSPQRARSIVCQIVVQARQLLPTNFQRKF